MNPWIAHVRAYAAKNKISYACAISEASKTYTKKTNKKEVTPEPKKEEPKPKPKKITNIFEKKPTNIFEFVEYEQKMLNDEPVKISTEKKTLAQIQEDRKQASKLATQQSTLKAKLVKKIFNPAKETKKEEKERKLREKEYEEKQAKYLANMTPEERAIYDMPIPAFKKKRNPNLIL